MIIFLFSSNGLVEFFCPFVAKPVWLNTRSIEAVVAGVDRKLNADF